METTGKLVGIYIDGEKIATTEEVTIEQTIFTGVIECECEIEFYQEAQDYFMKALMYALTYKN